MIDIHRARAAGRIAVLVVLTCAALVATAGATGAADAPTHRFEELAPGVFFATEAGPLFLLSNSLVVVNEEDVLVVDSHVTPAAARALIAAVATLTPKPITTLVNTHYHFDHAHGNLAFPPGVVIVGHEYTREKLAGDPMQERTYTFFSKLLAENAEAVARQAAAATDPATKSGLEAQAKVLANHVRDDQETRPVPPQVTLSERMTLHHGGREIQLHFLGRGHTAGDVVVFLPEEKIVFTGDLLVQGPSYMGDGFADEWIATLDRLKELDFELIVPGHGVPFRDRAFIDYAQAYLRDAWNAITELRASGISALEAALRVDLTAHQGTLGPFTSPLLPSGIIEPGIEPNSVLRVYELLDEREGKAGAGR
ncbi:MAG TPA: MBL fold metallo-hydrolase [Thermoanaerobaculia bacterium]|nr:MBL fold metallo-hydrolase [Thermoanaerobaculia bacterium]